MKLENYEVHLPNYSIGDQIYDKIGPICESYGKTVLNRYTYRHCPPPMIKLNDMSSKPI